MWESSILIVRTTLFVYVYSFPNYSFHYRAVFFVTIVYTLPRTDTYTRKITFRNCFLAKKQV